MVQDFFYIYIYIYFMNHVYFQLSLRSMLSLFTFFLIKSLNSCKEFIPYSELDFYVRSEKVR